MDKPKPPIKEGLSRLIGKALLFLSGAGKEYKTVDMIIAILTDSFIEPDTIVTDCSFGCNKNIPVPVLLQWVNLNA